MGAPKKVKIGTRKVCTVFFKWIGSCGPVKRTGTKEQAENERELFAEEGHF